MVRGYVYGVYLLVTQTEWELQLPSVTSFNAASFWQRLRTGTSELDPPDSY